MLSESPVGSSVAGERPRRAEHAAGRARTRSGSGGAPAPTFVDPRDRHLAAVDGRRRALGLLSNPDVGGADAADAAARARSGRARTGGAAGSSVRTASWSTQARAGEHALCSCAPAELPATQHEPCRPARADLRARHEPVGAPRTAAASVGAACAAALSAATAPASPTSALSSVWPAVTSAPASGAWTEAAGRPRPFRGSTQPARGLQSAEREGVGGGRQPATAERLPRQCCRARPTTGGCLGQTPGRPRDAGPLAFAEPLLERREVGLELALEVRLDHGDEEPALDAAAARLDALGEPGAAAVARRARSARRRRRRGSRTRRPRCVGGSYSKTSISTVKRWPETSSFCWKRAPWPSGPESRRS